MCTKGEFCASSTRDTRIFNTEHIEALQISIEDIIKYVCFICIYIYIIHVHLHVYIVVFICESLSSSTLDETDDTLFSIVSVL